MKMSRLILPLLSCLACAAATTAPAGTPADLDIRDAAEARKILPDHPVVRNSPPA